MRPSLVRSSTRQVKSKSPGVVGPRAIRAEQQIHEALLASESRMQADIDVAREPRLAPLLHRKAADKAELAVVALEERLQTEGFLTRSTSLPPSHHVPLPFHQTGGLPRRQITQPDTERLMHHPDRRQRVRLANFTVYNLIQVRA
jgi:hypothetical protein